MSTVLTEKFSQFTTRSNPNGAEFLVGFVGGANMKMELDVIKDFLITQDVNVIVPEGTDDTTIAALEYGINKVETSSSSDFCTRLPLTPIEGRSVTVINTSSYLLRVFPSVTGGDIEGVVNGHIDVLPDHKAVIFICWDNPNPGSWSAAGRVNSNTIAFGEMSVAHVNGTVSHGYGLSTAQTVAPSATNDGNGNLLLAPAIWRTENTNSKALKLKVYTNILENECGQFNPGANGISCYLQCAWKDSSNGVTLSQTSTIQFTAEAGFFGATTFEAPIGTLHNPAEIGDSGTFYGFEDVLNVGETAMIGTGGQFSRHFYTFGIQIGAPVPTKTFKFRFELEYV